MNKQELTAYLNSFPNLTQTDRDLLYNKIQSIYLKGQIEGAKELRELFHKNKQEYIKANMNKKIEGGDYQEGVNQQILWD